MIKSLKKLIENALTSAFVYNFFVKNAIREGFIKVNNVFIYVQDQSPYLLCLLYWRIYERREVKLIKEQLIKNITTIELGASLGLTTASICSAVQSNVNIYSVEANPKLIPFLEKTKSKNNFNSLTIISAAVDYSDKGKIEFLLDERNLGSHKEASNNSILVDTIKLSDITAKYNISEFCLVCDIEGAEVEMLLNETDSNTINNCQLIIMELHEIVYNNKLYHFDDIAALVCEKFAMVCTESIQNSRMFKKISAT